jgi:hypothetical protein
MRVHATEGEDGFFAGDVPDGTMVECPCGKEVFDKYNPDESNKSLFCECGKELVYRPWWSW